jgi:uncharacterized membrane protein YiaA
MKKHAGKAFYLGVMTLIFGLMLIGAVNFATGIKDSDGILTDSLDSMIKTVNDIALGLITIGVFALVLGMFMHTKG